MIYQKNQKKIYLLYLIFFILGIAFILSLIYLNSFQSNFKMLVNAQNEIKYINENNNKTENDFIRDKLFGSYNTSTNTTEQFFNNCKLMCTHNDIISNQTNLYYGKYYYGY